MWYIVTSEIVNFTDFLIVAPPKGLEQIWVLSDKFGFESFSKHYYQQKDNLSNNYISSHYEVSVFFNDDPASLDKNVLSRLHNLLVGAINDRTILPKLMVIIPDDDLINYFLSKGGWNTVRAYRKLLNNIMTFHERVIAAHKEFLPAKAKVENFPHLV